MPDLQAALLTQLRNIQAKTGRSLAELHAAVTASGLARHGEKRSFLIERYGLGYGDANTVVHTMGQVISGLDGSAPLAVAAPAGDPLEAIYAGPKAPLRALHEAVILLVDGFGIAYEQAPKKSYVSLRRKKQFAMVGPATREQIEVGLNLKTLPPHPRLRTMPPASMCSHAVRLASAAEVDGDLRGWIRAAFDAAG